MLHFDDAWALLEERLPFAPAQDSDVDMAVEVPGDEVAAIWPCRPWVRIRPDTTRETRFIVRCVRRTSLDFEFGYVACEQHELPIARAKATQVVNAAYTAGAGGIALMNILERRDPPAIAPDPLVSEGPRVRPEFGPVEVAAGHRHWIARFAPRSASTALAFSLSAPTSLNEAGVLDLVRSLVVDETP